ncbi:hypothetical protein [Lysobacter sp. cf310]|uniref:hypothetical protein n=1 Tax=Lysobacter sp. cf310 TaxID=1761790 RepID=UPI0008EC323E|nr:hypothetical protein [Lysobacter sp. cf310]SFK65505.1 hypothetical protein SAMN04487938_1453 [Lysobacter sp. cf310]
MRFGSLLAFSLLAYACHGQALAGSAPASLTCTPLTKGSSMQLDGTIPASEETLSLVVSSREHRYTLSDAGSETTVIESLAEGVFALNIRSRGFDTTLYAIPATVKATPLPYGTDARFVAKLTALRPSRHAAAGASYLYDDYVRDIKMSCHYRYEI